MVTERKIVTDVVNRYLLKEYVMKVTERAGFGGIDIQRNPMGTLITLIAERPGMVIGHRGKTIKELTTVMEEKFHFDNPQIEVEEVKDPNLNASIMAHKLAVALERGWHFRRAGHSTVRKIMAAGARGCQVVIAGKLTGERHRTEKFKEGHIKYCGEPAIETMDIGYAVAKKKLGVIGIKVMIMKPDAVLPDEIKTLNAEEAKDIVPEAVVEKLKIDLTPVEPSEEIAEKKGAEEVEKEEEEESKPPADSEEADERGDVKTAEITESTAQSTPAEEEGEETPEGTEKPALEKEDSTVSGTELQGTVSEEGAAGESQPAGESPAEGKDEESKEADDISQENIEEENMKKESEKDDEEKTEGSDMK